MVNIDLSNGVPIVEQIVTKINNLIVAGAFAPNEKIISIAELSKILTTSFNNVSQAYKQLEEMGLIYNDGVDFHVGNQKHNVQNNRLPCANHTSKSKSLDGVMQSLEENITLLLENDFTEDYLIELINKQESLLKIFEKNTASLLQQGVEKEKLVDLVKTINSRKF